MMEKALLMASIVRTNQRLASIIEKCQVTANKGKGRQVHILIETPSRFYLEQLSAGAFHGRLASHVYNVFGSDATYEVRLERR